MATHYIDPVDGDDGTADDTNINTPRKTWPSLVTTDTYLAKGGTTSTPTALINVTTTAITLGTYPTDMSLGQHTIDSSGSSDTARAIRVGSTHCTIENLNISPGNQTGNGHGIQATTAADNFIARYNTFTGLKQDRTDKAIDYLGDAPFNLHDNIVNGFNNGFWINSPNAGSDSYIQDNTMVLDPHANQETSSAAVAVLGGTDWTYQLHIRNNDLSGWLENAVDLVGGEKVRVYNNELHTPGPSSIDQAVILGGAATGAIGRNYIYNNYIHSVRGTTGIGFGINTRGGVGNIHWGNVIDDCDWAIAISSVSTDCEFHNETIVNCIDGIWSLPNAAADNTIIKNILFDTGLTSAIRETAFGALTYSYCCFGSGTHTDGTDGGNNIDSDPLINSDFSLPGNSPCISIGTKWWGTDSRPVGYDGEPFSDWDIDIGANQSLYSIYHPHNA